MCYIGCTGYYVVRFFVNVGTTFHTAGEDVTRYIYLSCDPVSVYVMYVCMYVCG